MEKYNAIYKCINDKLKESETLIEWYKGEVARIEKINLEYQKKNGDLELALCDETQKNNELTTELENLRDAYTTLAKAYEDAKDEINKLKEF